VDNRLRLNAAMFRNEYTDAQVAQFEAGDRRRVEPAS
jgi:hypothetical protein